MQAYESKHRRAEIDGDTLILFKLSGNVRISKTMFWWKDITDARTRTRAARRWALQGKISRAVH